MDQPLRRIFKFNVPKRYILVFMGFCGMFNVYAMRVNLSVAMVAMVNSTESPGFKNKTLQKEACPMLKEKDDNNTEVKYEGDQYDWDAKTQGMLLGAFFYGYMITQIPGGYISEKYGAKWLFGGGVLTTSVFTLLTPLAAKLGIPVFMAVRIIEGFGEGVTFPAMNYMVSEWAPVLERSQLSTIIFMGSQIGNVVSLPISGWLSSTPTFGGWPSCFYIFGVLGCIWFAFWAVYIYETPFEHPTISEDEIALFQTSCVNLSRKKPSLPWKSVMLSVPVWATLVAHFGQNFGLLIYITELPNYLSSILHYSVSEVGALSALPFMMQAVFAFFASLAADKLRSSETMSITWIRKTMNTIGLVGPAVCLMGVTAAGCERILVVFLFTLGLSLNGFVYSGFNVTHIDMSPDFAGTLYGITNTVANLCGVIAPAIVGLVTSNGATLQSWDEVLYITSALYVGGAVFFLIFASAEQQPWSKGVTKEEDSEMTPLPETDTIDRH